MTPLLIISADLGGKDAIDWTGEGSQHMELIRKSIMCRLASFLATVPFELRS